MIVRGPGSNNSLNYIIFNEDSAIFNPYAEFLTTYATSIISASLGLAKCLKNGVARPIGPGGRLDGLLSCRHLLAFFACGLCFGAKIFSAGYVVSDVSNRLEVEYKESRKLLDENISY